MVWASRWHHCRGFGIQSPWAYHFVCDVLNVRLPFYAYERLAEAYPDLPDLGHKLGRLYMRLANSCRPATVVDFAPPTAAYADYIRAGCRQARVVRIEAGAAVAGGSPLPADVETVDMARFSAVAGASDVLAAAAAKASNAALFIVESIGHSAQGKRLWKQLTQADGVSLTFDLYYCGIALFDTKRHKQSYKINF